MSYPIGVLFIGDIVGEVGVRYLEARLPALIDDLQPHFVVANAENLAISAPQPHADGNCGMTPDLLDRLFALGIDLVTGGNHSWDGPFGLSIHDDSRVVRPLNVGAEYAGRGTGLVQKAAGRLGVINLVSRTAFDKAEAPLPTFERQLRAWENVADLILVDFHGTSVTEKLAFAFAAAGRVTASLGTHTHVPTIDARLLPGGTAYITDVGMTGPGGGIQGYAPEYFVDILRGAGGNSPDSASDSAFEFATGAVELGAVFVQSDGAYATSIDRIID